MRVKGTDYVYSPENPHRNEVRHPGYQRGWRLRMYQGPPGMTVVPKDETTLPEVGNAVVHRLKFANLEEFRDKIPETPSENYVWRFTGRLRIRVSGMYTICTTSDDGSLLYVRRRLVVNNNGLHGPVERCRQIRLGQGFHSMRVVGFQRGGGVYMDVTYSGPDTMDQKVLMRVRRWPGIDESEFSMRPVQCLRGFISLVGLDVVLQGRVAPMLLPVVIVSIMLSAGVDYLTKLLAHCRMQTAAPAPPPVVAAAPVVAPGEHREHVGTASVCCW
jgi:hypothetical protein